MQAMLSRKESKFQIYSVRLIAMERDHFFVCPTLANQLIERHPSFADAEPVAKESVEP
jgi:hypothetical protein